MKLALLIKRPKLISFILKAFKYTIYSNFHNFFLQQLNLIVSVREVRVFLQKCIYCQQQQLYAHIL